MSEADNLYAGKTGFQVRGALADKGGHLGDRDGDVVFDAGTEFALGAEIFSRKVHKSERSCSDCAKILFSPSVFDREIRQVFHPNLRRERSRQVQSKYAIPHRQAF